MPHLKSRDTQYNLRPHPLPVPRVTHVYAEFCLIYKLVEMKNKLASSHKLIFDKIVHSHTTFSKYVVNTRVGVKYSTCTWYLYLSTYLSVLDVLEYLVCGNVKVLVLVLVLDQKVLGT